MRGIVQDDDGWLWIAGSSGLYRFDGVKFERITEINGHKLHKNNILALAWIDGALWLGYQFGGIERFKNGVATYFDKSTGLTGSGVFEFAFGPRGLVSAATGRGLYEWRGKEWALAWPAAKTAPVSVRRVQRTRNGDLFIQAEDNHLYRRDAGSDAFVRIDSDDEETYSLLPGKDGGFWTAGPRYGFLEYDSAARRFRRGLPTHATDTAHDLIFLRDGSAWMLVAQGIQLLIDTKNFAMVDELTRSRGLSDGSVQVHFEDREGNLWLGTSGGVDRIRKSKLHTVKLPDDVHFPGVAPGDDGSIWVTSRMETPLRQYSATGSILRTTALIAPEAVHRAKDGTIWAANGRRIDRYFQGVVQSWPLPVLQHVQSVAQAHDGSLWVSIIGSEALHHLQNGRWEKNTQRLGFVDIAIALYVDDDDRLWQAYMDDRIAVADGNVVTRFTARDGLRIVNVESIAVRHGHVWAGGEQALMFFRNGKFVALTEQNGNDFVGVSGIVETADGDLWFNGMQGLTHVTAAEVRRVMAGADARVTFERFDYLDGMIGQAPHLRPLPTLVEGPDSRLWYATNSVVGWIAPGQIARSGVKPVVQLRAVVADGMRFALATNLRLPARNASLRIDYTALALTMPERLRFRYRLSGVGQDSWTDAGTRRSAYYTELKPGNYQFEVQAANEDGSWNSVGAKQAFTVAPTVLQTTWFRLLCALAVLVAIWLRYRWRVRRVAAHMQLRMDERLEERTRVARALHDTILQSMQGIILHIVAARHHLPDDSSARGRLDKIVTEANRAYVEGRDQVTALRVGAPNDIAGRITETAAWLELAYPDTAFKLHVTGERRPVQPYVAEETMEIAREAIRNAFQHAKASAIDVTLDYSAAKLILAVRDDGIGMSGVAGNGHWGLIGIRERAARISAALVINGNCAPGTCLELAIPPSRAYQRQSRWAWRR